jgi:hypothetical protein
MTLRAALPLALLLTATAGEGSTKPIAETTMVSTSQPAETPSQTAGKLVPALLDAGLYTSVVAWRTLDFFSTEQCIHSPNCYESELPTWLVESKPAFIAFEGGSAAGEIVASRWLHARGHGRLARLLDLVSVTGGTWAVAHNYANKRY